MANAVINAQVELIEMDCFAINAVLIVKNVQRLLVIAQNAQMD